MCSALRSRGCADCVCLPTCPLAARARSPGAEDVQQPALQGKAWCQHGVKQQQLNERDGRQWTCEPCAEAATTSSRPAWPRFAKVQTEPFLIHLKACSLPFFCDVAPHPNVQVQENKLSLCHWTFLLFHVCPLLSTETSLVFLISPAALLLTGLKAKNTKKTMIVNALEIWAEASPKPQCAHDDLR